MAHDKKSGSMIVTAIGVVFGDIGTSPLYTFKECFSGEHAVPASPSNVLGILSLIFWSILIVISLKYVVFIMKADNKGVIVSPFFAKPEMDPSDVRSKKLATLFAFGCPRSSCVRPVFVLRFAAHSNRGYHK